MNLPNFPKHLPGMYGAAITMAGNEAVAQGKKIDLTIRPHCHVAPNGDHKVTIDLIGGEKFVLTIENDAVYQWLKAQDDNN